MRRLALLYLRYKEHADVTAADTGTAMDMFRRSSHKSLEHSINVISKYDDDTVKSGLKIALKFLIPNAASVLESNYLISGEDAKAEEVAKFITVFNMKKKSLFCDASYQIEKARQTKLRKPSRLPLETDLIKVRSYTRDTMSKLVNDKNLIWDSKNCRLLRDTAVARLTLFNARRGGEPCNIESQCNSEPEDSSSDDSDDASTELNQEPPVSAGVKDVSPVIEGVEELQAFLNGSNILNDVPEDKRKIQLLRTKIFNERKSFRSKITNKIVEMLA
ncbi:hypothetical protein HOLleu_09799 [Holothuria leucospilota]|uniref:Uncharacterized protein n=1 Tax=Holothuria leucospilota TaxID=206669 RepID=A0A9Q1HEE3_HOLLE|nr:hypothetical protein HOLleu_09799 [Holothuria leucospilota]